MGILKKLLPKIKNIPNDIVKKQRESVAMALQILQNYPQWKKCKKWEKYKNICGVIMADEVGFGKTFEALSIIALSALKENKCKVLIIVHPAIRKKWEKCNGNINGKCLSEPDTKCNIKTKTAVFNCHKYDIHKFLFNIKDRISQSKYNLLKKLFNNLNVIRTSGFWKKNNEEIKKIKNSKYGIWICSPRNLPKTKCHNLNNKWKQKDYTFTENFLNKTFNWIIVDEAHTSKAGYNENLTNKDGNILNKNNISKKSIHKITAAINTSKKTKLLLLTATPFQNNESELKALVELLGRGADDKSVAGIVSKGIEAFKKNLDEITNNPERYRNPEILKDKIKNIRIGLDKNINTLLTDDDKMEINLKRPKKLHFKVRGKNVVRESGLDDFMLDLMIRHRKPKPVIRDICGELTEKQKLHYLLMRDMVTTEIKNVDDEHHHEMFSVKLSQLASSYSAFVSNNRKMKKIEEINKLFKNLENIFDYKFYIFEQKIDELFKSSKLRKHGTIVVFSTFIPTINELKNKLEKENIEVEKITGDTPLKRRTAILERLKKTPTKKRILLVSRVGNEGLDFDEFSRTIIHYDWHYNPAVIDQRNGRIYRGTVLPKQMLIYRIFLKETYGQRIVFIQEKKKQFKDFYLGDSSLDKLIEFALDGKNIPLNKKLLDTIKNLQIDLAPNKKYLLSEYRKLL